MAALLSSSPRITSSHTPISRCEVPHPFTPPYWLFLSFTSDCIQLRTYDSYIFDGNIMQEIFLRSLMLEGTDFLRMVVTYSSFHTLGHTLVAVMELKMLVSGTARKSPYVLKRAGKMSPRTIDLGFLKARIRPATSVVAGASYRGSGGAPRSQTQS